MKKFDPEKYWPKEASKALVGRKITGCRYMTAREASSLGWEERAVVLVLDDGSIAFPQRDDEGNGPGAFVVEGTTQAGVPRTVLLPVL